VSLAKQAQPREENNTQGLSSKIVKGSKLRPEQSVNHTYVSYDSKHEIDAARLWGREDAQRRREGRQTSGGLQVYAPQHSSQPHTCNYHKLRSRCAACRSRSPGEPAVASGQTSCKVTHPAARNDRPVSSYRGTPAIVASRSSHCWQKRSPFPPAWTGWATPFSCGRVTWLEGHDRAILQLEIPGVESACTNPSVWLE